MMLVIAQNEDLIDTHIRNLIQNAGIVSLAKHLLEQLEPISAALNTCQSDKSSIADACEQWLKLFDSTELEPHKKTLEKRFSQAMTPIHFLANVLHPQYRGKKMNSDNINQAQELLHEIAPELVPHLLGFMTDCAKIPKVLSYEDTLKKTDPVVWWKSVKLSGALPGDLCDLATKILQMPASSAGIERVFSNFALIQTKLRNRLGLEKAGKLVFCYRMLSTGELDWQ